MGNSAGRHEPRVLLGVGVDVTVRTVLDLLHLVFGNLDHGLGHGGELVRGRVKDNAVVQHPLGVGQEGLGGAVVLLFDVSFHGLQIHGKGDVV